MSRQRFFVYDLSMFFISAFPVIILSPSPIPHRFLFRPRFSCVHAAVTLILLCKPPNKKSHKRISNYASYINTEINLTLRKAFVLSFYLNVAINLRSTWRYRLYYITCQQNRSIAPTKMTDNFNWKSKP